MGFIRAMVMTLLMLCTVSAVAQQTYVELILDASGSMWNKMDDGRTRIQVAKTVLKEFIEGLPEGDINVGLRIYGSEVRAMEPGSCDDSRLFVPLDGVDKPSMVQNVDDATAQGSTPIALSLRLAAQDFPADAGKRLIVIVTDGEESCEDGLDAVVEELKAMGIDIDLNIIGLDLNQQAIESFEDIGTFVNAESAAELATALEVAIEEVVVVEEIPIDSCEGLEATIQPATSIFASTQFETVVTGEEGRLSLHPIGGDEYSYIESGYVDQQGNIDLLAPSVAGPYELRYITSYSNCLLATQEIEVMEIQATIDAPDQVEAGYEFAFSFEGPEGRIGFFDVGEADNTWSENSYSYYATSWNDVKLRAPSVPAVYELRYIDKNNVTVGSTTIEVTDANVTLETPEQVEAGYEFIFTFGGPDGSIAIYDVTDTEAGKNYSKYSHYQTAWNEPKLRAPSEAGTYEVRYVDKGNTVVATRVLEVLPSLANLETPAEVEAGYEFTFTFEGPDGSIAIYDVTDTEAGNNYGKYSHYQTAWNRIELRAPSEAGMYEIRYVDKGNTVVASRALEVLPSLASLETPVEVEAGYEFEFTFEGPDGAISIYDVSDTEGAKNYNKYSNYNTAWNNVVLTAPSVAGTYEIRYADESKTVIASRSLEVLPSLASLGTPAEIEAGYEFEFTFEGPDGTISIYDVSDTEGGKNYNKYSNYNTAWNNVVLTAPSVAGAYEIRYIDQSKTVIVSKSLEVLPSQASLGTPVQIEAGYVFTFPFNGPEGTIAIYDATDTEGGKNYAKRSYYNTKWNKIELLAPSEVGMYEVRYTDTERNVLVTSPLEVLPTQATLTIPAEVVTGEKFAFSFTGPQGNIGIFELTEQNNDRYSKYSVYNTKWNKASELEAPEQAGNYEIRYIDGNKTALVTVPLIVR